MIVQNAAEEHSIRRVQAQRNGAMQANAFIAARADNRALTLAPEITELRARGHTFRQIAATLNERGIASARGRKWGPAQVLRLLRRADNAVANGTMPDGRATSGA